MGVCVYVWVNVCVYECVSTLLRKSSSVSENNSGVVQYRHRHQRVCVRKDNQSECSDGGVLVSVCVQGCVRARMWLDLSP